jgi:hypothetical protein
MKEKQLSEKPKDGGWNPDTPTGQEALTTEERSLDIDESGQFAPAGYFNQQMVRDRSGDRSRTTSCHRAGNR